MQGAAVEIKLSFTQLTIQFTRIGADYQVLLSGGEKPHIGCTVLAVPRLSLKQDGSISSTASVINVTGHKDEILCRYLAEKLCAEKQSVVVCSGGFHMDHMTEEQIREVEQAVRQITMPEEI